MKPWMAAVISGGPELKTRTFTSNETFVVPFGVSQLESLSGKGAAGLPPQTITDSRSRIVSSVIAFSSGSGPSTGSLTWNDFQGDAAAARNIINAGGSGSFSGASYAGFPNTNTYSIGLNTGTFTNAVPGSAYVQNSAGWKTSGPILVGDDGASEVYWQEYAGTTPATTGASATGFGRTFPGGTGGAASTTTFGATAVTGGQSYSVIVPSGGSITITYYQ